MRSLIVTSRAAVLASALALVAFAPWLAAQTAPLRLFSTPWSPFRK